MRPSDSHRGVPAPGALPLPVARCAAAQGASPPGRDPAGAPWSDAPVAFTPLEGERARAAWRAAENFADLLELGAGFLAGRVRHFPGWGVPETDSETDAIRAPLLALNRLGFLSLASQPALAGSRGARHVRQRAFVTGFAPRALAERLVRPARIDVRAWHADGSTSERAGLPVEAATLEDGIARVLVGHAARAEELTLFEDDLSPAAQLSLRATSYVAAFDAEFGRGDRLWTELERFGRG